MSKPAARVEGSEIPSNVEIFSEAEAGASYCKNHRALLGRSTESVDSSLVAQKDRAF